MNKINVGVVGCGVVGFALIKWIEEHNLNCNIIRSDPPKGLIYKHSYPDRS